MMNTPIRFAAVVIIGLGAEQSEHLCGTKGPGAWWMTGDQDADPTIVRVDNTGDIEHARPTRSCPFCPHNETPTALTISWIPS